MRNGVCETGTELQPGGMLCCLVFLLTTLYLTVSVLCMDDVTRILS